jgi:hypothetical protein
MTPPSKRMIALAAVAGIGCLLLGEAIARRRPAAERAPGVPAASLGGGLVASGSEGGIDEDGEKDAAPKRGRRHRFHQPHELPDESLPPPPGWRQGDRDQRD